MVIFFGEFGFSVNRRKIGPHSFTEEEEAIIWLIKKGLK